MIKLILIILLATSQFAQGQIAPDKIQHFKYGTLFSVGSSLVIYEMTGDRTKAFWGGVIVATLAGLSKELIDQSAYGGSDSNDLLATSLGGFVGSFSINFLEKRHKKRNPKYNHKYKKQ